MRSHAWSVAAVVLALLPCVSILYPLGLAFGIWAATVMFGRAAPYAFRGEQPPPGITARGSGSAGLLIGLGAAAVVVVPMMGVMAALAIYGVRRYVYAAKTAEAREGVMALAHGVVRCAEARGGVLPESGEAVPPDAASVRGGKYQSAPEDWSSEPFACAGFSRTAPQYYQFRWIASSSELGHAEARGDLDADGNTSVFRVQVSCADGRCTADPVVIEQDPLE